MKICSKCKIEKDLSEFSKCERNKDNKQNYCKKCNKKYKKSWEKNNKEEINKYHQKYRVENRKELSEKQQEWEKSNPKYKKRWRKNNPEYDKKYKNSKVNYDTFASQILWAKDPVKNVDGFLQTKCTYCGRWYYPTNQSVQHRIKALNGEQKSFGTECRLYCSEKCKLECPIYHKHKYPKGFKNYSQAREVQPELRQMVFERDEYTCIKCGKHQDDLDVPLHCHHIEGIVQNPIESADIDICVTVCKDCHKEIHQQKDCGYNDMKCNNK